MAKLAEGTGLELPPAAVNALNPTARPNVTQTPAAYPTIATQCFLLSNMFDPAVEQASSNWLDEIRYNILSVRNIDNYSFIINKLY